MAELESEVDHEVQRSEFYKGSFLRRKGNKVAVEEFDKFKAKIKAEAILEAMDSIGCSCETSTGDDAFSRTDLDDYADKLRGES